MRKLKGKDYGISADLLKEIINRRIKMPLLKKAKQQGKTAYFSRPEPNKLLIGSVQVSNCI